MIFTKTTCLLALSACLLQPVISGNSDDGSGNSSSVAANTAALSSSSVSTSSDSAAAAATSISTDVNAANSGNNGGNNNNNNNSNNSTTGTSASVNGGSSLTLDANAVQTGSQSNGLANAEAGQAASDTDNANFINFCSGKPLTNGLQTAGGSCNGIVMGDIPSSTNMISTIITNPGPGDTIAANQDFNVNVQVANLVAGSFTNPDSTYYAAPQALQGGKIVGHTHVTIQSLGNNIATPTPPDAGTFAFFKGINDAGNGQGALTAAVTGGLPAGVYRVCTMTSASNHQPVTMPLAQRGSQDDCNKFTVSAGGASSASASNSTGNANANANANTGSGSANTGNAHANSNSNSNTSSSANGNSNTATAAAAAGTAATSAASDSSATSSASSSSSSTASSNQNGSGKNSGKNGNGKRSFVGRAFVA